MRSKAAPAVLVVPGHRVGLVHNHLHLKLPWPELYHQTSNFDDSDNQAPRRLFAILHRAKLKRIVRPTPTSNDKQASMAPKKSSAAPVAVAPGPTAPITTSTAAPTTSTSSSVSSIPSSAKKPKSVPEVLQHTILSVIDQYHKKTPQRTKLIDIFLAFLAIVGALQFVYCVLAGNYVRRPYLSQLSLRSNTGNYQCTAWLRQGDD